MMKFTKQFLILFGVLIVFFTQMAFAEILIIKDKVKVQMHYTLWVEDELKTSTKEKEPMTYIHGYDRLLKPLRLALEGKSTGDVIVLNVSPEDAYGAFDESKLEELRKDEFNKKIDFVEGMILPMKNEEGRPIYPRVHRVHEETVVLNHNHPLAGKRLRYELEVLSIAEVSDDDIPPWLEKIEDEEPNAEKLK